jgi:hypothetical protein
VSLAVLIPFRAPRESPRGRAARRTAELWSTVPDVIIQHASDRGEGGVGAGSPWSYAAGANRARAMVGERASQILLVGADHIPPSPAELQRIRTGLEDHPWLAAFSSVAEYSERTTDKIIAGLDPARVAPDGRRVRVCVPILAMWASVFDSLGGMDQRYVGWGYEDSALRLALRTVYPEGNDVGEGSIRALWHPRATRRFLPDNLERFMAYERAAADGPDAMFAHLATPGGPLDPARSAVNA